MSSATLLYKSQSHTVFNHVEIWQLEALDFVKLRHSKWNSNWGFWYYTDRKILDMPVAYFNFSSENKIDTNTNSVSTVKLYWSTYEYTDYINSKVFNKKESDDYWPLTYNEAENLDGENNYHYKNLFLSEYHCFSKFYDYCNFMWDLETNFEKYCEYLYLNAELNSIPVEEFARLTNF